MNNELYKMMIRNARTHLDNQDPNKLDLEDFTIFKISEVLALCLCKRKEDVLMDIFNLNKQKYE